MKKVWKRLGTAAFWIGWAGIYAYLRFSRRTKVLVTHKDKVLLVKNWLGPDEWSLPGGGVRLNEEPLNSAARELMEETGISVEPGKLKLLHQRRTNVHGLRFFYGCFAVDLPKLLPVAGRRLDVTEAAWFDRKGLKKLKLSPDAKDILQNWI